MQVYGFRLPNAIQTKYIYYYSFNHINRKRAVGWHEIPQSTGIIPPRNLPWRLEGFGAFALFHSSLRSFACRKGTFSCIHLPPKHAEESAFLVSATPQERHQNSFFGPSHTTRAAPEHVFGVQQSGAIGNGAAETNNAEGIAWWVLWKVIRQFFL